MEDRTIQNLEDMESDGVRELGNLSLVSLSDYPDSTMFSNIELGEIIGRSTRSIQRAVERGELPPPTRLFGKAVWMAGQIRKHVESSLEAKAKEREELNRRISQFGP